MAPFSPYIWPYIPPTNQQVYPKTPLSPTNQQVYPKTSLSPTNQQVYPKTPLSPTNQQVCPKTPLSPTSPQVSRCILTSPLSVDVKTDRTMCSGSALPDAQEVVLLHQPRVYSPYTLLSFHPHTSLEILAQTGTKRPEILHTGVEGQTGWLVGWTWDRAKERGVTQEP